MKRRVAIAGLGLLGIAGTTWAITAALGPSAPRVEAPAPVPAPEAGAVASLAVGPSRAASASAGGVARVAAPPAAEEPLVPDGPPTAPPSAVRVGGSRQLWADPLPNSPMAGMTMTKYPADGLPRGRASLVLSVVDAAGDAVSGASVRLDPPSRPGRYAGYEDQHWIGRTDASGSLRAADLPAGPAAVLVFAFGHDAGHPAATREIRLPASGDLTLAVRLDRSSADLGRVAGRVVDDEGTPLVDAYVFDNASGVSAHTDADGRFRFDDLTPGSMTLHAMPDGCERVSAEIEVKPRAETAVELRSTCLDPGPHVIRGRVVGPRGEPVAGAHVWVRRHTDKFGFRQAITDVRGRFELRRLSDALVAARFGVDAYAPGYSHREVEVEELSKPDATIELPRRSDRATLSVRVLDAATGLVARKCLAVAWREGAPAERAENPEARLDRQCETGEGGGTRLAEKDRDGPLEAQLEPGPHRLTIESPEFTKWEGNVRVVEPPEVTRVPDVRLARRRARVEDVALTVRVELEPGGDEFPNIQVEVLDPLDGSVLSKCRCGTQDRRYSLPALSGDWRLRVTAAGFHPFERAMRLPDADPEPTITVHLERK